jgi:tetratricopeptide (TPR) repeat protein
VIERLGPDAPLPDPVAALAYHASGSGVASRIVIWNRRAAEAAAAKGAMDIAQRLLGDVVKAEQQLRASRTDRGATYRQLAIAAERAGHPDAALDALVRASRLSASATRCELTVERSRMLEKLGRYRAALTLTGRALRNCRDPGVRGHLQLARATVHNFRGEWSECLTLTRALLADRSLASDERLVAQAHLLSLWCCVWLGLPDAAEHAAHAERLMIELDDSLALANLYLNRGIVAWNECRVTAAVDDFALSAGRYNRAGDVVGAALADNNRAEVLTFQFRLDEAEALLKRARRITEAANYPHGTLTTISGLSRIAAWRGEIDAALELQQEALRGFRELDADPLVLDSLLRLAEIHLLAHDVDSAMRDLAEAEGLLRGLGEVKIVPATLARLRGRALAQTGSDDAARAEFEAALAVAEQDGFAYEAALAKIGIGRLDTDQHAIDLGMTMLGDLDVLAPPPGT